MLSGLKSAAFTFKWNHLQEVMLCEQQLHVESCLCSRTTEENRTGTWIGRSWLIPDLFKNISSYTFKQSICNDPYWQPSYSLSSVIPWLCFWSRCRVLGSKLQQILWFDSLFPSRVENLTGLVRLSSGWKQLRTTILPPLGGNVSCSYSCLSCFQNILV